MPPGVPAKVWGCWYFPRQNGLAGGGCRGDNMNDDGWHNRRGLTGDRGTHTWELL